MIYPTVLAFAGIHHQRVQAHLFPGDGLEATAILLCGRSTPPRVRLLVRDIILVPHDACRIRRTDSLTWPGHYIEQAIDRAEREDLTIVLIHSHPGGLLAFSATDDDSDLGVMPSLLLNHGQFHGSAIMVPDGSVRARCYRDDMRPQPIELVTVAGHNLLYWWEQDAAAGLCTKRPMAFTSEMSREMGRLTAGFVGISGTGSINAEQGCRLGFGRVKLIDFDKLEMKNLNRILNATLRDARAKRLKVDAFAEAVTAYRGEGVAEPIPLSILTREAIIAAGQCDVLVCGVDSQEARQIADLIAIAYLLPLFDVGVVIPVRDAGGSPAIGDVCGRIDYVQPGLSTLRDRGVYTPEGLRAEYLRNVAPDALNKEIEAGYIPGIVDEAPAVITLNMRASAACMNEFIARAYPYRHENNQNYARTQFSLAACEEEFTPEIAFTSTPSRLLGRGSMEPLLDMPFLRVVAGTQAA
jgi:ThiF family/Prokaryotic homologs of the JAB domain